MRLELPSANANVQIYTYATIDQNIGMVEWVKPAGAAVVVITCIGPGGGGGAGTCVDGTGGTGGIGGGGGTGGAYTEVAFPADSLPASFAVAVDESPRGGAGVTSGMGSNSPQADFARSVTVYDLDTNVTITRARGGLSGVGGGNSATESRMVPSAENARGGGQFTSAAGGPGGGVVGADPALAGAGAPSSFLAPSSISNGSSGPGGGGGGITLNLPQMGGWGGSVGMFGDSGQSTPGLWNARIDAERPANPGLDALPSVDRPLGVPGSGGSGGGASVNSDAGVGANGAAWGGGGGGGGAARPGFTSGAGGNGGSGLCIIATYF